MIYELFRTNTNLGLVYTICDLAYVKWLGDERMETFRNNWETTLAGMSAQVDDSHLTELLLQQMMQSKELKDQVTQFRKRDLDDPLRCYHTLVDMIDEHLVYQQEAKNRQDHSRSLQQGHSQTAAPGAEVCPFWLRGHCRNSKCPKPHPPGLKGEQACAKSEPRPKGTAKPKAKAKAKGAGKGRSDSPSAERSNRKHGICARFQIGECPLSAQDCPHRHEMARDAKVIAHLERIRSRPASPAPARPVCRFYDQGTCTHGTNCRFQHTDKSNAAPAPTAKAKAKSKAKAAPKATS
jgi:hypothetical protein